MKQKGQFDPWVIEYDPADGARIGSLKYEEIELLTTEPRTFTAPKSDFGVYETRPVYGYDDCFPSVNVCGFPKMEWKVPDHGEICWLPWEVREKTDSLIFEVKSQNLAVRFKRRIKFRKNQLIWAFSVENQGNEVIPFQHVMHPLMPLRNISDIHLPNFERVFDEIQQKYRHFHNPDSIRKYLLSQPAKTTHMFFLQNIKNGRMSWDYQNGLEVEAIFSKNLFPTIGIWWNNNGYPDELGCRRNECALEPIPGDNSTLSDAYEMHKHLEVNISETFEWEIIWKIRKKT